MFEIFCFGLVCNWTLNLHFAVGRWGSSQQIMIPKFGFLMQRNLHPLVVSSMIGLLMWVSSSVIVVFISKYLLKIAFMFTYLPLQNTSVSPDGKLLAVLGDSTESLIADANTGKVCWICLCFFGFIFLNVLFDFWFHISYDVAQITGSLKGHLDYSFASAWHPDGRILATGNQDTTCRLWDVRNLSQSMAVLKGRMGAIRALRFTSDGRFLAMAEPADFVHIFDSHSGYEQGQEIDLFGEIAGISFSPDTEALFVGIADRTYGSLLEFTRKRYYKYLDSML